LATAVPLLLSSGFILFRPGSADAQTWTGTGTNSWNTASNWNPATVPNSSTATVIITNSTGITSVVIGGINPTIANLTLGSTDSVSLNDNQSLTLAGGAGAGTIDIAGTLNINSGGNNTDLILGGTSGSTITLSGGGTLSLDNRAQNRVYSTAGNTLINSSGNTIQGSGQFGIGGDSFSFTNNGTVNANQGTALTINTGTTTTNTGTLEATSGGTLNLTGTYTNTGGTIFSTGTNSVVNLGGATVDGGTLTTSSGGTINNNGIATLNGVTISTGSTLTLLDNTVTTVQGTITSQGTIAENSGGNNTDLRISGAVTLTGGGTLTMDNRAQNRVYGLTSGAALTNDVGFTIQGSGQLGIGSNAFAFTNKGVVDANQGAALTVNPGGGTNNSGTLEATTGGTLNLVGSYANGSGSILSNGAGSAVNLNGATITGGTLTTQNGGVIQNNGSATLIGVTVSSGSTLTLLDNTATTLQGTVTLNGAIAQNSGGNNTDLILGGSSSTVTLTGGGSLTMDDRFQNRIYASGSGDTLLNSAGSTIQGSGQLGIGSNAFTLNNQGTVDANQGAALTVNPGIGTTNTGTLEATSGGTLNLNGTYTNTSGTILSTGTNVSLNPSTVNLSGSTINGGTLTTSGGALMFAGNSTLDGVTISGGSTVTQQDNTLTTLMGTITNHGTIAQESGGNNTDLRISGPVLLTGGGTLAMDNRSENRVYGITSGATLTNDVGFTIQGSGQLGIGSNAFTFTNNGVVDANQSTALTVNPGNTTANTGTLEATSGGTLNLVGVYDNAGGTILSTGTGSTVNLDGSTIHNGTLTTAGSGAMLIGQSTLDGVTITAGSTATQQDNTVANLEGTITNNGTIAVNSGGNNTDLRISGAVTLTGSGTLSLDNRSQNRVYGITSDAALTNDVNHTIQGSGQFGIGSNAFVFTNNGTVIANQSTALTINPGNGTTNNGTFQANSGSTLVVEGPFTNYNATTSTLTGGRYNAISGTIALTEASTAGGHVIATNAATILLDGAGAKIVDGSNNDILRTFLASNLAAGSLTIQDGALLTTSSTGFSNAGIVNIGAGSALTVGGTNDYVQTGGTTTLSSVSSSLVLATGHSFDLDGGTLQGIGTLHGNLINDGGTVMPGTPGAGGVLSVTGTYIDPPSSQLFIQIGGPDTLHGLSQLVVGGAANLNNGTLDVSLINGFTPTNGELFEILAAGSLSGTFLDNTIVDGNVTFTVVYDPNGFPNTVFLDASVNPSVPEPASWLMLGLGMLGAGALAMRTSHNARGR
jgi:hypothetical protein